MMNKKGQTLVFFIVFIPFILMLASYVIDLGYIQSEKIKLNDTTKIVIKELYKKDYSTNQIKQLYQKNDIKLQKVAIKKEEDKIKVSASYEVESIFGKLVGIKKYLIKTTLIGKKINEKIEYQKE
ncbi:MAG TPA: Tad domain-containing protein [Bacilli bacterium]|nr:Tad domain-containing protein [Bacilli bacterium]